MSGRNGRKFDHDDACRRYRAGETKADLAAEYGVSVNAVRWAIDAAENRYALRRWWQDRHSPDEIRELARALTETTKEPR